MKKVVLNLQPSEAAITRAAAAIYSAYIVNGRVKEGSEKEWMQRCIDEALWIARSADEQIQSDSELG